MAGSAETIGILLKEVAGSQSLQDALKRDPVLGIEQAAREIRPQLTAAQDKFTFRLVVIVLSAVVLIVLGLIGYKYIILPDASFAVPDILVAIGSTALGALAGILAPTPARGG